MMILDTNVVSEIMRPRPSEEVLDFLDRHPEQSLYLTTITIAEILAGAASHKDPAQRTDLHNRAKKMLSMFSGRELPFKHHASMIFSRIMGPAKLRGITISFEDCAIAAIALSRNCPVASRDKRPFHEAGVQIVDPWISD